MKSILKFVTAIFIIANSSHQLLAQINIIGKYDVHGLNPNNSQYAGTVTISKNSSNQYDVVWLVGSSTTNGSGKIEGKTLTVFYGEKYPAIYQIKENGNYLDGKWGAGGTGSEALTKVNVKTGFKGFANESKCYCCSKNFSKGSGYFWYREAGNWNIFKESQDLLRVGVGRYCCSVKCCEDCKHTRTW